MKKQPKIFASLLALGVCPLMAHADLVLNEVMQSNVYCIMDDINEFPDSWVEIYNNSDAAIDIQGYKLGVKDKASKAYTFTDSKRIEAGGYLLVYCDKVGEGLHTDFRVDSGKGSVYLFDAEGNVIDEVSLKKMPAPDIAYGRKKDGEGKWGYQLTPTPGKANTGETTDVVLGEVTFSEPGGVWKSNRNISLNLSLPDNAPEGSYIIYTIDGSEPVVGKASVYENRILVKRSTVVRAKAVCDGCLSIPSSVQSYIFLGRVPEIPVISIVVNNEYLYDYNIGIFAEGPGGWNNENFRYDWRRPINIEYFEPGEGTEASINQLCETRVQGGYTRQNPLKSMAVYANKRFGVKRFDYELWHKDKPGVTDNKSFILRNGGNDYNGCYVRDGLMHRIMGRNTDNIDWQGYAPVIVLINGKYHAMLALRERSNEDNISANYDGLEDIDMVENWGEDIKAGDTVALEHLLDFIKTAHTWDEWAEIVNLESYTNLMALNFWIYNTDFPHNNIMMWRRTDGVDGRWQWLIKDCDFGLGIYNNEENINKSFHDYLYSNSVPSPGFDMYQQLIRCEEFRQYYINHLIAYMGDFLNADTFKAYLDEIWEENKGEQQISHDTWNNNPWWKPDLPGNIRFMRNWIDKRQRAMASIMKKTWDLGNPATVNLNVDLTDDQLHDLNITYADVPLTQNRFKGNDFVGRTINVKAGEEDNVTGWTVKVGTDEPQTIEGKELSWPIASSSTITINAIIGAGGISNVGVDKDSAIRCEGANVYAQGFITAYDMAGREVAKGLYHLTLPAKGIYMIKGENGTSTKVSF